LVPIATFLAGSLLTLLLPIAVLISLVAWYWWYSVRQHDAADGSEPNPAPAAANPPPAAANPPPAAANPPPAAANPPPRSPSEPSPPAHEA
jgi:hypothetical protein